MQHYEACDGEHMRAQAFISQCVIWRIILRMYFQVPEFTFAVFVYVHNLFCTSLRHVRYSYIDSSSSFVLYVCVCLCLYLLSCWAWHIRVHIHWRRQMSWWRLCEAEERLELHHTLLWRQRESIWRAEERQKREEHRRGERRGRSRGGKWNRKLKERSEEKKKSYINNTECIEIENTCLRSHLQQSQILELNLLSSALVHSDKNLKSNNVG